MPYLSVGMGSWGGRSYPVCPSAPGMLQLHIIRSDPISPVGPVGTETGTMGLPTALLLNPSTTHCSWSAAALNMEGPDCRDGVTASLRALCSVTQELGTFPRAATTDPHLLSHSQGGSGVSQGRASPDSPQESPGCEKAEPRISETLNSPQHLTGHTSCVSPHCHCLSHEPRWGQ